MVSKIMTYISEYFYSNCLIEAIKAKIKHPIKVKIKYIPARLNVVFCPHLMWHDGEYTYDFWAYGPLKPYQILWYKGKIRKNEYDYYDKCIKTLKEWKERNYISHGYFRFSKKNERL